MLAPVFCCPRASTEDAADAAACHPELDEGEDDNREGEINRIVRMVSFFPRLGSTSRLPTLTGVPQTQAHPPRSGRPRMTTRNRAGSDFRIYITFWYFTYVCLYIYILSRLSRRESVNYSENMFVSLCTYLYMSVDYINLK